MTGKPFIIFPGFQVLWEPWSPCDCDKISAFQPKSAQNSQFGAPVYPCITQGCT